ncbi:hypothetical protein ACHAXR_006932 [Thalassiosira sp. AJA248-18]
MTVNVFSPTADGILAALLAPFFMSLGFFIWDCRWTSSGASAFALNRFIIMCLVRGFALSSSVNTEESSVFTINNVGFLVLSSTLGIIVGDVLWLEALRLLGAKHVIVIDSLKPFAAAILGRLALDEVLMGPAWGGMVLTVIGVGVIAWEEQRSPQEKDEEKEKIVQTEVTDKIGFNNDNGEDAIQSGDITDDVCVENSGNSSSGSKQQSSIENINKDSSIERKNYRRGYICAIINVLADSLGSLLTKMYGVGMTTWSINLIRFGFAGVVLICISTGMRCSRRYLQPEEYIEPKSEVDEVGSATMHIDNSNVTPTEPPPPQWFELPTLTRIGWLQITAGVGLVTFLHPALGNYALFQIALGLAVSLGSIGPLYGLFMDWPFKGKRPTIYGCIGVLMAVAGVIILCVWGT